MSLLRGLAWWATKLWGHMGPGVSRTWVWCRTLKFLIVLSVILCLISGKRSGHRNQSGTQVCVHQSLSSWLQMALSLPHEHRILAHPQCMQVQQDTKQVLVHLWLSAVSPERPPSLQIRTCFEYRRKGYKKHKWPRSHIISCLTRVTSLYEATTYTENDDREEGRMG